MVTLVELEELSEKLVSEKAKLREEGQKVLFSYLTAESGARFQQFLDEQTAEIREEDHISTVSWPGLLSALCSSIRLDIAASRRRPPRLMLAKTLRLFVQKAEEGNKGLSQPLFLRRKVKALFQHILDVMEATPSFASEYSSLLRILLPVMEYRIRMGIMIYRDLVHLHLQRLEMQVVQGKPEDLRGEEAFRNAVNLLMLLQNRPGDLPETLREDLLQSFCQMFTNLRDEGRLARKLLAALNAFLIHDGLNLDLRLGTLHSSVRAFMARTWFTTRDRDLKEGLVLYAWLQLRLRGVQEVAEGGALNELLALVRRELDQAGPPSALGSSLLRDEGSARAPRQLAELAALVLAEAAKAEGVFGAKESDERPAKRRKHESVLTLACQNVEACQGLWPAAVCLLLRHYHTTLPDAFLLHCLQTMSSSLSRSAAEGTTSRGRDVLVWKIRCLEELARIWPSELAAKGPPPQKEPLGDIWLEVMNTLLHFLPAYASTPSLVDEILGLLGFIAAKDLVTVGAAVSTSSIWDLRAFKEQPSINAVNFVADTLSRSEEQGDTVALREHLLRWMLHAPTTHESCQTIATAVVAIIYNRPPSSITSRAVDDCKWWAELSEEGRAVEAELVALQRGEVFLAACGEVELSRVSNFSVHPRGAPTTKLLTGELLDKAATTFDETMGRAGKMFTQLGVPPLLNLCTIAAHCLREIQCMSSQRATPLSWGPDGSVYKKLVALLQALNTFLLDGDSSAVEGSTTVQTQGAASEFLKGGSRQHKQAARPQRRGDVLQLFNTQLLAAVQGLIGALTSWKQGLDKEGSLIEQLNLIGLAMERLLALACDRFQGLCEEVEKLTKWQRESLTTSSRLQLGPEGGEEEDVTGKIVSRIYDNDLDARGSSSATLATDIESTGDGMASGIIPCAGNVASCIEVLVGIMVAIGRILPEKAIGRMVKFLKQSSYREFRLEVLAGLCDLVQDFTKEHLSLLVESFEVVVGECRTSESGRASILRSLTTLCSKLRALGSDSIGTVFGRSFEEMMARLVMVVNQVVEHRLHFWPSRIQLVDAVHSLLKACPSEGQVLAESSFLPLLQDLEYRVRLRMAKRISVLFEIWDGHEGLLEDIIGHCGVKLVRVSSDAVDMQKKENSSAWDMKKTSEVPRSLQETVAIMLGNVASTSADVESEVVFMLCAQAASTGLQALVCAVLDKLARSLSYVDRWQLMAQHIPKLMASWVQSGSALASLLTIQEVFTTKMNVEDFWRSCSPHLLPSLFFIDHLDEVDWLAEAAGRTSAILVKENFTELFAALLPLHCSEDGKEQERAAYILQGTMLDKGGLTEGERDELIRKRMITIVSHLLKQTSAAARPNFPYSSAATTVAAICTLVDGFVESVETDSTLRAKPRGLVDPMKVFRADRTFALLLQLHMEIQKANHGRHKRHYLAGLAALIEVLDLRVAAPSTFRYIVHILLQCIEDPLLQEDCCRILQALLGSVERSSSALFGPTVGHQLQPIVSKLVACTLHGRQSEYDDRSAAIPQSAEGVPISPFVWELLEQLTVRGHVQLHKYIKELDAFPNTLQFEGMRSLHSALRTGLSLTDELVQFARRAPQASPGLRRRSLRYLCNELKFRKEELQQPEDSVKGHLKMSHRPDVVAAVWRLVKLCGGERDDEMCDMAGQLLAAVGIWDSGAVSFHIDDDVVKGAQAGEGISTDSQLGVDKSFVRRALLQLDSFLVDHDVQIIEISTRTLQGLLATEKGQDAFSNLSGEEKLYMEVHCKSCTPQRLERMIEPLAWQDQEVADIKDARTWSTRQQLYEDWVCNVVHALLRQSHDPLLRLCQAIAKRKAAFAEMAFPHVLGDIAGRSGSNESLCSMISAQVEEHVLCDAHASIRAVQLVMDSMNKLRHCYVLSLMTPTSASKRRRGSLSSESPNTGGSMNGHSSGEHEGCGVSPSTWKKVYWLSIDYLVAARAAQRCAAVFTSILYVEHWCEEKFGCLTLGDPDFSDETPVPLHEQLLLDAYSKINEPDGIYGVARTNKVMARLALTKHEGRWDEVLATCDLIGSRTNIPSRSPQGAALHAETMTPLSSHVGIGEALKNMGCLHVLDTYRQGLNQSTHGIADSFAELQFEAAWRSGKWDAGGGALRDPQTSVGYHSALYSSLAALAEGDGDRFGGGLKQARQVVVTSVAQGSMESMHAINLAIVKLQVLDEVADAWPARWPALSTQHLRDEGKAAKQIQDFKESAQLQGRYDLLDPLLAVRTVLLKLLQLKDCLPHHLCRVAGVARKASRLSQAGSAVEELKHVCGQLARESELSELNGDRKEALESALLAGRVEEGKLMWIRGQQEMAVSLVLHALQHLCSQTHHTAYMLSRAGKWLAATRSLSSRVILDQYLHRAASLSDELVAQPSEPQPCTLVKSPWRQQQCSMHFRAANYADMLYRSYMTRLNSSEWQAAQSVRQHKRKELEAIQRRLKTIKVEEARRALEYRGRELSKQLALDDEEDRRLKEDKDAVLLQAVSSYRKSLMTGDKYDIRAMFRLVAIWFELAASPEMAQAMLRTTEQVASRKFLPLVYQLASRMANSTNSEFQVVLMKLVIKMANEHPYHTLNQLLALANGDRVPDKRMTRSAFVVDPEKKEAALTVLRSLRSRHAPLLAQMQQMIEVYIRLAELETRGTGGPALTMPRDVRSIRELNLVPVVTAELPVDPTCTYSPGSFPHFCSFTDKLIVMNGINAPKVVECLGSDGRLYKQLAKSGNDDLRQDAVMEQLFGLVNALLKDHPDTRTRQLHIRTYKVVPFTPSAGVLEWVNGTLPLGDYLHGPKKDSGAHARYGIGQWTYLKCREVMTRETDKFAAFSKVYDNFRPVMRHFFTERFAQPETWFEKRLAYSRSLAAASMVGYIVGLGDRHSMNILLDTATAEVVHIDLGVAFEQGLMLKTPERVPFRLTRDLVDALGVCGVEGVFRRCCEATLAVLRANKEALLTIVMVFLHDPLYKWALSPLKALHLQEGRVDEEESEELESTGDAIEGNQDAARALLRVKQKLDGYEEGELHSLQGQVQHLIQSAQDTTRLCVMFPGWGAWL